MGSTSEHNALMDNIMLKLQQIYGDRLKIKRKVVGMARFKRGNTWTRPYKIGVTGESDLYGSIRHGKYAVAFEIEVKTGKAILTEFQKKNKETCSIRGIKHFVARELSVIIKEFKEWDVWIKKMIEASSNKSKS